ncbi:13071_t:CDS:1, partial [Entrophospora sp. SA101]
FQQRFKVHMSYPADDVAVPDSTQVFDISSTIEALKFLRMVFTLFIIFPILDERKSRNHSRR